MINPYLKKKNNMTNRPRVSHILMDTSSAVTFISTEKAKEEKETEQERQVSKILVSSAKNLLKRPLEAAEHSFSISPHVKTHMSTFMTTVLSLNFFFNSPVQNILKLCSINSVAHFDWHLGAITASAHLRSGSASTSLPIFRLGRWKKQVYQHDGSHRWIFWALKQLILLFKKRLCFDLFDKIWLNNRITHFDLLLIT